MLEAETAGGKRKMLGSRESPQTRRCRIWPKLSVDRSNDENAKPTRQNRHGAKNKGWEAKKHKKQKPSNAKLSGVALAESAGALG